MESVENENGGRGSSFPTTDWGLLADCRGGRPAARLAAMDILIRRYGKPVFLFLRYSGADFQAANLLQTAKRAYPLEALRVSAASHHTA